jgi:lipopolysaccharide export system protein LptA
MMPALALDSDLELPVNIKASKQFIDLKENKISFIGPVFVTQGSILIQSDELEVIQQDNKEKILIASGNPARYQQTMETGEISKASANTILYDTLNQKIFLIKNAKLHQHHRIIKGEKIQYLLNTQTIVAESGQKKRDRVTTILKTNSK